MHQVVKKLILLVAMSFVFAQCFHCSRSNIGSNLFLRRLLSQSRKGTVTTKRSNQANDITNPSGLRNDDSLGSAYKHKLRNLNPLETDQNGADLLASGLSGGISVHSDFPTGAKRDWRLSELGTSDMELTFLGTASCTPSIRRGVSCMALRYKGASWLFDCGESSQLQLQKSCIRPGDVKKIFVSHMHGDHSFGLPGVLCMLGQAAITERYEENYEILDIYGPEGIRDYVRAAIQLSHSKIVVPHRIHELKCLLGTDRRLRNNEFKTSPGYGEVGPGTDIYPNKYGYYDLVSDESMSVKAASMVHTVPCVGFVVEEATRPGMLRDKFVLPLFEKNLALIREKWKTEYPLQYLKNVKKLLPGEKFVFPDGTELSAEDAMEPPQKGRKVCLMGDTCSGKHILDLAMDCDILIHEATNAYFPDPNVSEVQRKIHYAALERDTRDRGHSTPQMAGSFAAQTRANQLILTHFSSRYPGDASDTGMRVMWHIEDMARDTCRLQGPNDVVAAWDMLTVPVRRLKRNSK